MDERIAGLLERHGAAVATAAAWARTSGADRIVLLLSDAGGDVLIEALPGEPVELQVGEDSWLIDAGEAPEPAVDPPPAAPGTAIHVDPVTDEIQAPIGAIDRLAEGVAWLARAFGERAVASVEYPTDDPELPLEFAAREGDGVVLAVGDRQFEL